MLLVTDADGDGYGSTSGMSMIGCPPLARFAPSFDDCNDTDANIHPGATEVANGRDDNCNGKVDDLSAMPGTGGSASTGGSAGMAPTLAPAPTESGCAFAPSAPLPALPLLGGALLFGWAHARRAARRGRGVKTPA